MAISENLLKIVPGSNNGHIAAMLCKTGVSRRGHSSLSLLFLGLFFLYCDALAAVPDKPAEVALKDRKLSVRARNLDGTLAPARPFTIKGVCWSPASRDTVDERWARQREFGKWYKRDLELIAAMRANAVYVFIDFAEGPVSKQILDQLYHSGIMAIVTVDLDGTNDLERIKYIVPQYRDHPAILMWAIGNEWNINLYHHKFSDLRSAAEATEQAARLIKSLDSAHPVASIYGEIKIPNQTVSTSEIVNSIAASVDLWGLNIYRGDTFGTLFDEWRAISEKPIFISEFGTDSFRTKKYWPVKGVVDEQMQAEFMQRLWGSLQNELDRGHGNSIALGGTVFEWVDEWWKVRTKHGGRFDRLDANGFPTPWNRYSHPDGFANEEYFGIVRIDRSTKPLYQVLQQIFSKGE